MPPRDRLCMCKSFSSAVAVIVVATAILYGFFAPEVDYNLWPTVLLTIVAGAIVFIKHKDNIIRLANGTEKKISAKKEKK